MDKLIFDKTDKGREEIATRKYGLAPRMRSLLVLVDGKKSRAELLVKVAGLGLDDQCIIELIDNHFIEYVHEASAITTPATTSSTVEPVRKMPVEKAEKNAPPSPSPVSVPVENASGDVPDIKIKSIAYEHSEALHKFFNETIKSTIGFRGFFLQLKAEQAQTVSEFRELRIPFLEAVLKAQGQEMTISLRDRLDELLEKAEKSTR